MGPFGAGGLPIECVSSCILEVGEPSILADPRDQVRPFGSARRDLVATASPWHPGATSEAFFIRPGTGSLAATDKGFPAALFLWPIRTPAAPPTHLEAYNHESGLRLQSGGDGQSRWMPFQMDGFPGMGYAYWLRAGLEVHSHSPVAEPASRPAGG